MFLVYFKIKLLHFVIHSDQMTAKFMFDQIGYIINEYVPDLYKYDLFKYSHILKKIFYHQD